MSDDDKRERMREYQRKWREKNGPRKQEYMRKWRRRRKSAELAQQPEDSPSPTESLGTITAEAAQAQDAAFQAAMAAAIAAGHERAVTGVSTVADTNAPIRITVNRYRIACK